MNNDALVIDGLIVELKFTADPTVKVIDSYQMNSKAKIKGFLRDLHETEAYKTFVEKTGFNRTFSSQVHEWAAHNFLYEKDYEVIRTKSVDINQKEGIKRRIIYFILSLLYRSK